MPDFVLDLLLPRSDRAAVTQMVVMGGFWAIAIAASGRGRKEYRLFVVGLALLNLAWFGARAIH